ncbi:MAG: S8 family peptidase [Lachnospiraceae bacterium]|nr:S8 family peptidase [Lachnospiraceae bacterium]
MPYCEERIYSNDYFSALLDFWPLEEELDNISENFCYMKISNSIGVLVINKGILTPLSFTDYTYRLLPKLYTPMQNVSFPLLKSGILQAQQPPLGLTGRNVIIGIADSGIDYTMPAFRREDGSSRILAIWDQTIPYEAVLEEGREDSGMPAAERMRRWNDDSVKRRGSLDVPFGTVYTQTEINEALQSDNPFLKVPSRDETGHGSAMAGAAGGKVGEEVYGGAINAEYVIVKCRQAGKDLRQFYYIAEGAEAYSEADIMLGYRFMDSYCEPFRRPLVYCFGMGSNMGPHDGTSLFSEFLDDVAQRRSRAVVVCGGNEGNQAGHFAGEGDTDVELRAGEGVNGFTLEIWGSIPEIFSIIIMSPGGESSAVLSSIVSGSKRIQFIFEQTLIYVEAELAEQSSGRTLMVLRFENPTPGIWRIKMRNAGTFHMWLPVKNFLSGEVFFLAPDPEVTLTEPAYAQEVITISAYADATGAFWGESGRGFAVDGRIKPDFAAPGVDIPVPGRAPLALSGPAGAEDMNSLGSFTVTGSSMAGAITAGAVAQFLEWAVVRENDVFIKGREIKSYFQRGASKEAGMEYPDRRWGERDKMLLS